MRISAENYGWNPIESAPLDEDVTLQVTDGRGEPYALLNPSRLIAAGWVSSDRGTPLAVTPVKWWRYFPARSRRPRTFSRPARGHRKTKAEGVYDGRPPSIEAARLRELKAIKIRGRASFYRVQEPPPGQREVGRFTPGR
jgi:hypothetical protein